MKFPKLSFSERKTKLHKLSISVLIIFIISGCAVSTHLPTSQKEQLLQQHLQNWNAFRADGIVTLNYQNFAFRKNINIQKSANQIKITIYDSGIFGMKPQPFLKVKIDSLIQIESITSDQPEIIPSNKVPAIEYLLNPFQLLKSKKDILQKQFLILNEQTRITFSDDMEISIIEGSDKNFIISFVYENDLSEIEVIKDNEELVKIEIDKITYDSP
jgi:hypothetical protein